MNKHPKSINVKVLRVCRVNNGTKRQPHWVFYGCATVNRKKAMGHSVQRWAACEAEQGGRQGFYLNDEKSSKTLLPLEKAAAARAIAKVIDRKYNTRRWSGYGA